MKRFVDATVPQVIAGGFVVGFIFLIIIFTGMSKFSAVDELNENIYNDSSVVDDSVVEDEFDVNYQE